MKRLANQHVDYMNSKKYVELLKVMAHQCVKN